MGAAGAERQTISPARARISFFMNLFALEISEDIFIKENLLSPVWITTSCRDQDVDGLDDLLGLTQEIEFRGSEGSCFCLLIG